MQIITLNSQFSTLNLYDKKELSASPEASTIDSHAGFEHASLIWLNA